jgi:hypothetical protein
MQTNDHLPADLRRLRQRFEQWRATREKQTRIPAPLLEQARALLSQYPVTLICRVCRLHPHSLRKARTAGGAAPLPQISHAPAFLSLPATELTPELASFFSLPQTTGERQLVLARPDGVTLSLTIHAADHETLTTICAQFLRA